MDRSIPPHMLKQLTLQLSQHPATRACFELLPQGAALLQGFAQEAGGGGGGGEWQGRLVLQLFAGVARDRGAGGLLVRLLEDMVKGFELRAKELGQQGCALSQLLKWRAGAATQLLGALSACISAVAAKAQPHTFQLGQGAWGALLLCLDSVTCSLHLMYQGQRLLDARSGGEHCSELPAVVSPEGGRHAVDVTVHDALPPRNRHPCNPLGPLLHCLRALNRLLGPPDWEFQPAQEPRRPVLRCMAALVGMAAAVPLGEDGTQALDGLVWRALSGYIATDVAPPPVQQQQQAGRAPGQLGSMVETLQKLLALLLDLFARHLISPRWLGRAPVKGPGAGREAVSSRHAERTALNYVGWLAALFGCPAMQTPEALCRFVPCLLCPSLEVLAPSPGAAHGNALLRASVLRLWAGLIGPLDAAGLLPPYACPDPTAARPPKLKRTEVASAEQLRSFLQLLLPALVSELQWCAYDLAHWRPPAPPPPPPPPPAGKENTQRGAAPPPPQARIVPTFLQAPACERPAISPMLVAALTFLVPELPRDFELPAAAAGPSPAAGQEAAVGADPRGLPEGQRGPKWSLRAAGPMVEAGMELMAALLRSEEGATWSLPVMVPYLMNLDLAQHQAQGTAGAPEGPAPAPLPLQGPWRRAHAALLAALLQRLHRVDPAPRAAARQLPPGVGDSAVTGTQVSRVDWQYSRGGRPAIKLHLADLLPGERRPTQLLVGQNYLESRQHSAEMGSRASQLSRKDCLLLHLVAHQLLLHPDSPRPSGSRSSLHPSGLYLWMSGLEQMTKERSALCADKAACFIALDQGAAGA